MYRTWTVWATVVALAIAVWAAGVGQARASSAQIVVRAKVAAVLAVESVDAHHVRVHANTPWTLVWAGTADAHAVQGGTTGAAGTLQEVPDDARGWTLIDRR